MLLWRHGCKPCHGCAGDASLLESPAIPCARHMGSPGASATPELVQDGSPHELPGRRQIRLPSDASRSAHGGARSVHADVDSRSDHSSGSRSVHGGARGMHADIDSRSADGVDSRSAHGGGSRSVHPDVGAFRRPASGAPSLRDGIASMSPVKVRDIAFKSDGEEEDENLHLFQPG